MRKILIFLIIIIVAIISFKLYKKKEVFDKPALFKEFLATNRNFDSSGGNGAAHLEDKFIQLIKAKDYDTLKFCLDNMEEWRFEVEKQNIIINRRVDYSFKIREIFKSQIYQDATTPMIIEIDFQINNESYFLKLQRSFADKLSIPLLVGAFSKISNEPLLRLKYNQDIEFTNENIKNVKISFVTKNDGKPIVLTRSFQKFVPSDIKDPKDINTNFINKSETEIIETLGKPTTIYDGFKNYGKSKPLENIDATLYYQLKSGELFIYIQNKVCVSSKVKQTGLEY